MRTIAVALTILSACSMHEVSGLVVSAAPKKEAMILKEAKIMQKETRLLKQLKDPVILAALQEIYARADELIVKASKPGASEAAKKAKAQITEDLELAEEALQTKADGTLSDGDEQHDEQDEKDKTETEHEEEEEQHDEWPADMSEALKNLEARNDELQDVAESTGASEEAKAAATKSQVEFDEAMAKEGKAKNWPKSFQLTEDEDHEGIEDMSEALKKLDARNDELQAAAESKGASEEAKAAARKSEKEFDEAMEKEDRKPKSVHLMEEQVDKEKQTATKVQIQALLYRAEELAEEAQQVGASDAAKKAADEARQEYEDADAKAFGHRK